MNVNETLEEFKQIMGGRKRRTRSRRSKSKSLSKSMSMSKRRKTRKSKISKRRRMRKTRGGKGPTEDPSEDIGGTKTTAPRTTAPKTSAPSTTAPKMTTSSPFSSDSAKLSNVKKVLSSLTKELEGFSVFSEFPSSYGVSMDNAHGPSGAGAIRGATINPTQAFRF